MADTLAAEMGAGQFEIAIAQLAIAGAVIGIKKMVNNIHERRDRKRSAKEAAENERQ